MVNIGEMIAEGDTKTFLAFGLTLAGILMQFIQGEIPDYYSALMVMILTYYFIKE